MQDIAVGENRAVADLCLHHPSACSGDVDYSEQRNVSPRCLRDAMLPSFATLWCDRVAGSPWPNPSLHPAAADCDEAQAWPVWKHSWMSDDSGWSVPQLGHTMWKKEAKEAPMPNASKVGRRQSGATAQSRMLTELPRTASSSTDEYTQASTPTGKTMLMERKSSWGIHSWSLLMRSSMRWIRVWLNGKGWNKERHPTVKISAISFVKWMELMPLEPRPGRSRAMQSGQKHERKIGRILLCIRAYISSMHLSSNL